ncbi:MAG: bifunctional demethylmenaquinone methyltransferase/2-methoxy-6-polyprenyl-1,4-benzoquinol methylase UbiE [Chlamydiia bacterium]
MQIETPSKEKIWEMFNHICQTYDQVNRAMTGGLDQRWRKQVARLLPKKNGLSLLDCATGTADQILSIMKHTSCVQEAVGIDLADQMLAIGKKKIQATSYAQKIQLIHASALDIPFPDDTFDCVTMSFGIRNVTCPTKCLQEIYRVLKPSGRVLILESSIPSHPMIKQMHKIYLRQILPRLGGWLSDKKEAYIYLNQTIETFPSGQQFLSLLERTHFIETKMYPLLFGAVTIYQADKVKGDLE